MSGRFNFLKHIIQPSNVESKPFFRLELKAGDIVETHWKNYRNLAIVTEDSNSENTYYISMSPNGFVQERRKFAIRNCFTEVMDKTEYDEMMATRNFTAFFSLMATSKMDNIDLNVKQKIEKFLQEMRGFPFPIYPIQLCAHLFGPKFDLVQYYSVNSFMTENTFDFIKDNMKSVNAAFYLRHPKSKAVILDLQAAVKNSVELNQFKHDLKFGNVKVGVNENSDLYLTGLKQYAFSNLENQFWNPFELPAQIITGGVAPLETPDDAYNILKEVNTIEPDFNPTIFQSGLILETKQTVIQSSTELLEKIETGQVKDDLEKFREDFYLPSITIDSPKTSEVDDAVSIETNGNEIIYHVHVADPTTFIKPNSIIDHNARYKCTNLYLPENVYPIIPFHLAVPLGILENKPSLAFTISFKLDLEGNLSDYWIRPTRLHNTKRMSYHQVEDLISGKPVETKEIADIISKLDGAAQFLLQSRLRRGSTSFELPKLDLVFEDGIIKISEGPKTPRATTLVTEFMLAAGMAAANIAQEQGIPVPFRRQDRPIKMTGEEETTLRGQEIDIVTVQKLLRKLQAAYSTAEPGLHWSLSTEKYCKVTSPLRRYKDVIAHRQLKGLFDNTYFQYDLSELKSLLPLLNDLEQRTKRLERASMRFWTLKLLERLNPDERINATVLDLDPKSAIYEIYLNDYCFSYYMKSFMPFEIGDKIQVVIRSINPYRNKLEIEPLALI